MRLLRTQLATGNAGNDHHGGDGGIKCGEVVLLLRDVCSLKAVLLNVFSVVGTMINAP